MSRILLCHPASALVMLAAVALGAAGCVSYIIHGIRQRSVWAMVGSALLAGLLVVMYFFIGVLTLPGCSGV